MRRQIDERDRSHKLLQNLDDIASELQDTEISKKYQELLTPSMLTDEGHKLVSSFWICSFHLVIKLVVYLSACI
jgi:hypothetical protein